MELEQVIKLIDRVSASELAEFSLEEGNLKIFMKKKRRMACAGESMPFAPLSSREEIQEEKEGNTVVSPLVGTFYSSPSPEAEPFVKAGDTVSKGQTLGIIEAMKLMNEVECDFSGTVTAVLVENAQMVEYGQPLFVIK